MLTIESLSINHPRFSEQHGMGITPFLKIAGIALATIALSTAIFIRWQSYQERYTPFCCPPERCANPSFSSDCGRGCFFCACPIDNIRCLTRDEWWIDIAEKLPQAMVQLLYDQEFLLVMRRGLP